MNTRKLSGWQWAAIIIFSYCGALALSMSFAMPNLPVEQRVNALTEIVWNLRNSLKGTSVNSTLLFGCLVGLGSLVCRMREAAPPPRALLPVSFFIALVWLMGASFSINNTLESLDSSPGQIVKSICYLAGSVYLLYELGQLLFCFLEQKTTRRLEGQGKLARMYQEHPFLVSFVAILLCWLPHLIIAYPGYMDYDSWDHLSQFFGKTTFTAHHPPVYTLFLGSFAQLGLWLGNVNIGIYIPAIIQALIVASILAYTLFLMKKWGSPRWLRIMSFGVIVLMPYYTDYVFVAYKDTLYSAWLLLFIAELICILEKRMDYFKSRKHLLLLTVSIMGTLLFRNNGKHVLYPTILVLLAFLWSIRQKYEKKDLVKPIIFLLAPVLAANLLSAAIIEYYDIEKGSIKEALSLPFQQTARYVRERGDEVTEEEAEAIRAVLDYDNLAKKYKPRISDRVKNTYKDSGKGPLLRYFITWGKMFFKHPEIYVKATMNQNYYLLYPFAENEKIYTRTVTSFMAKVVNGELGVTEVEALHNPRLIMNGVYKSCLSLPVIGIFSNQAPYCILLTFLIVFAIHKKLWRLTIAVFPVLLSIVIIVLAPVIQESPRYAFPIFYSMPVIVAYYIYIKGRNTKS